MHIKFVIAYERKAHFTIWALLFALCPLRRYAIPTEPSFALDEMGRR